MLDDTKSKLLIWAVIAIMVFLMGLMLFSICEQVKAEELETLVNEYPVWVVSTSGDSTFQTVRIIKCWETFPNGQRELLGYRVVVDSSGCRIYEEESVWFLRWAIWDALRLQVKLGKQKGNQGQHGTE